jgi:ABC-2 type transport system permease protein
VKDAVALFVRTMLARAYPRVMGLVREPGWILQETVLPILSVAAYAFVYRSLNANEFVGFVILGGALTAFWLNVLWAMGAQLYWERDSGNLEPFIISPAPMMAILAGMALGGMVMTLCRVLVIIASGVLLFGVPLAPTSWTALLGVFTLTLLALYGLGMVFASAFLLWGREAWHVVNLFQEPVYLVSGVNYPVRTLGVTVAVLASAIPLTLGVDALRQVLFPGTSEAIKLPLLDLATEVALLAVLAVVYIALAAWLLRVLERIARREGRLTVRGQ